MARTKSSANNANRAPDEPAIVVEGEVIDPLVGHLEEHLPHLCALLAPAPRVHPADRPAKAAVKPRRVSGTEREIVDRELQPGAAEQIERMRQRAVDKWPADRVGSLQAVMAGVLLKDGRKLGSHKTKTLPNGDKERLAALKEDGDAFRNAQRTAVALRQLGEQGRVALSFATPAAGAIEALGFVTLANEATAVAAIKQWVEARPTNVRGSVNERDVKKNMRSGWLQVAEGLAKFGDWAAELVEEAAAAEAAADADAASKKRKPAAAAASSKRAKAAPRAPASKKRGAAEPAVDYASERAKAAMAARFAAAACAMAAEAKRKAAEAKRKAAESDEDSAEDSDEDSDEDSAEDSGDESGSEAAPKRAKPAPRAAAVAASSAAASVAAEESGSQSDDEEDGYYIPSPGRCPLPAMR
jgi:hypothetical protein